MGFIEVLRHIRSIMGNFRLCKQDLLAYKPDVLILVDYPGFNLRMAGFARQHGIRTVYYISPQIWAWKQSRVRKIRKYIDKMLVILPFEQAFYKRFGVDVHFTGHPLLDALDQHEALAEAAGFRQRNDIPDKPLVAVLPGSRRQEISRMLKIMSAAAANYPDHHFVIAGMSAHPAEVYSDGLAVANMSVVYDQTYALLRHAEAAMVTSGTATLETALFDVPQVVCYKTSAVTYWLAKRLIKVPYISLVNLIMEKLVIKELIQHACNRESVSAELGMLLSDSAYRQSIMHDYHELRLRLGGGGASARAAALVVQEASA
jgi:lipid-A-disaccharide synthase